MATNAGLWDQWYSTLHGETRPYGNTETYQLGAEWLRGCALVEDWGCGGGYARQFFTKGYRGIDGSRTPFADEVCDLAEYRSTVPGVFMRHVLEHDFRWERVLDNALASFTERMALILFTPLSDRTHDLEWEDPPGVPNLSFRLEDLTDRMPAYSVETLPSATKFGVETIFRLER